MTPRRVRVADVMSTPVVVVRDYDSVWHAIGRFVQSGLRHLVVVDDADRLVGVLDDRKVLARWSLDALGRQRETAGQAVRTMGEDGPRLRGDEPVPDVARLMVAERLDALAVVDDAGTVRGIVTVSDLLRALVLTTDDDGRRAETLDAPGAVTATE